MEAKNGSEGPQAESKAEGCTPKGFDTPTSGGRPQARKPAKPATPPKPRKPNLVKPTAAGLLPTWAKPAAERPAPKAELGRAEPVPANWTPIPYRTLVWDENPNWFGVSVVDWATDGVKVVAWWFYDLRELNKPLHRPSNHPDQLAQNRKRAYELSMLAKTLTNAVIHYRCQFAAGEALPIKAKDHGKGKRFNRLVNNQWCRKTFDEPAQRRLARAGIPYVSVNPAFSSLSGNLVYGWGLGIPDPCCAAVELGRRAIEVQIFNDVNVGGKETGQAGGMQWKQCPSLAWPVLKAAHERQKTKNRLISDGSRWAGS